jgi:hypothetical protein
VTEALGAAVGGQLDCIADQAVGPVGRCPPKLPRVARPVPGERVTGAIAGDERIQREHGRVPYPQHAEAAAVAL